IKHAQHDPPGATVLDPVRVDFLCFQTYIRDWKVYITILKAQQQTNSTSGFHEVKQFLQHVYCAFEIARYGALGPLLAIAGQRAVSEKFYIVVRYSQRCAHIMDDTADQLLLYLFCHSHELVDGSQ